MKPLAVGGTVIAVICAAWLFSLVRTPATPPWRLMNIAHHLPDLRFTLTDQNSHTVTGKSYRGYVTLLYFGYTGCSSQCPVTLVRLETVLNQLGSDARRIRVLFASIKPAVDRPVILQHYLALFDPRHMTGLTGTGIEALAQRYRAAYRPYASSGDIPHSAIVYIFDAKDKARLLATPKDSDSDIIHDLRRLIHETG